MALKDFSEGRTDVYKVDPRKLQIRPDWNSRDFSDPANQQHVEELAKSIAEVGVREPLKVFVENDVPYITNGECRYRAVMLCIERGIEIKTVPVMGEDRNSNDADRLFTQFISNSGKQFSALENARLFKRLIDLGWQQNDIAKKTGFSAGRISQVLELLTLPLVLQQFIIEGKASANMVLATFKKHNGDVALAVAELSGAVAVAQEQGRTRAMPKDTSGEGEGSGKAPKPTGGDSAKGIKQFLKLVVEKAYAEERVDDTESMVTMTFTEEEWADLMQKIDY